MKQLSLLGFVGLLASVLAGCPIYGNDPQSSSSCSGDFCGTSSSSSSGHPGSCTSPSDCGQNSTCGQDGQCHSGDCSLWGCVAGFECDKNPDQTVSCVPGGGTGGTGAGGATTTSTTGTGGSSTTGTGGSSTTGTGGAGAGGGTGGGPTTIYCGNPKDCAAGQTCAPNGTCQAGDCVANGCIYGFACSAEGTCKPSNLATCATNADCSGAGPGYACLSGLCTQPADLCFDQTQCAANNKCAAGKCVPSCAADADCPAGGGFACDTGVGLCTKPIKSCTITNDCGGPSSVCIDGACVPRSNGPACPAGDVWVENGCISNQSPTFLCVTDGVKDACAAGSLCLHHSCYIACDSQQNPNACTNLASFNQCKSVTTSSGAHEVCGSAQNLGGDCDPTNVAKVCQVGKICVDGFCK